jgi:thiamine biosynthesis lipoprotein
VWKTSLSLLLTTAALYAADRYHATEPHMGTVVAITLYAESPEHAQRGFVAAFARIAHLDALLSDYNPASELSRFCSIMPSPDLRVVVEHAQRLARQTGGAFDITAGPLSQLWRTVRKEKRLPSIEAIEEARARSGYQKLQGMRCTVPGMKLDAGGIAKGYAADEALAVLRRLHIGSALVAVSGDIAAGNPPPGKSAWRVRVQNEIIPLANLAVSTSGDEFQYLEIDGIRYSHIFDPRTGMALSDARPVSVIAPTGIEADSLATAISVLGPGWEKSIALPPGIYVR